MSPGSTRIGTGSSTSAIRALEPTSPQDWDIQLPATLQPKLDTIILHLVNYLPEEVQKNLKISEWTADKKGLAPTLHHVYQGIEAAQQISSTNDACVTDGDNGSESGLENDDDMTIELVKLREEQGAWLLERESLLRDKDELLKQVQATQSKEQAALTRLHAQELEAQQDLQDTLSEYRQNLQATDRKARKARAQETQRMLRHRRVCLGQKCRQAGCAGWRKRARELSRREKKKWLNEKDRLQITERNDGWDNLPTTRASRRARPSCYSC